MTEPVTESVAEIPGLPGQKPISKDNTEEKLSELLDGVRVTSPASSEDLESLRKNRNDSGCSYIEENLINGADTKKIGGTGHPSGHSTDSGHGSNEIEEGMIFAYHFLIPSHLCGKFFQISLQLDEF